MKAQLKENNFSVEGKKEPLNKTKTIPIRPNIDNLIKRIIVEKRKDRMKNLLIIVFLTLVIIGFIAVSI